MNVLLVSQCNKRALTETRRILDQFGERRGDRTWQTPITLEGLNTLRKLLKKTARKNTAVACHWIRGLDYSELLWIVGDASRFNAQGSVPTNITERDVLKRKDENDWHSAYVISLLARMAALWHDFGKASVLFQLKLQNNAMVADPYRHEWVSLRLFQAFVGTDDDAGWLERLRYPSASDASWQSRLQCDGLKSTLAPPLAALPPLARAVGWLILTHHRLPKPSDNSADFAFEGPGRLWDALDASWCGARLEDATPLAIANCWKFELGLPNASATWREEASKLAIRMLARRRLLSERDWLQDPFVAHLARAALMMADHQYSSEEGQRSLGDARYLAYANTNSQGKKKQRLDEHLIGVANHASRIVTDLPRMAACFARIARHKAFSMRTTDDAFRWQDRAYDVAVALQHRSAESGFFGVNMASTGCGKTLANARIMYGLSNPLLGARFCVALGLRTLTLQTGEAYRTRLRLNEDDLAVMIGSSAVRVLHERTRTETTNRARGSASSQPIIEDQVQVRYEGTPLQGAFGDWLKRDPKLSNMLNAPVLVCTVDHLMPACEATRGGHQIAPILRLMTSDLVLDEPDDFDLSDLPALTRLVHFAGLFGSRVLLSSATLAPALLQGLFAAYRAGREAFQRNRGRPGTPVKICCAWFDEYKAAQSDHAEEHSFATAHTAFVVQRLGHIAARQEVRRRARIVPVAIPLAKPPEMRRALARLIQQSALELHAKRHVTDPQTGKRVSIGLVRMANIDPLIDVARNLFAQDVPGDQRLHLSAYHSRFPLLLRSHIEQRLDRLLTRHDEMALFKDPEMRAILDSCVERDQVFMVLASPVAEVGRDHCYDWAVVEPSSMRSIIQLAGRVRRHRPGVCTEPNIILLDCNRRALEDPDGLAFQFPGFETAARFKLNSHRLSKVLLASDYQPLNAAPRIQVRETPLPRNNLVDLEHYRLGLLMLESHDSQEPNVRNWWQSAIALTAHAQRQSPFRRSESQQTFILAPDEDRALGWCWKRLEEDGRTTTDDARFKARPITRCGQRVVPWGTNDYPGLLQSLCESEGLEPEQAARRFASVQLPEFASRSAKNASTWLYDPVLGLRRDTGD